MQGAGASIDDVRVVVQALNNWFDQIRSTEVHFLKGELNAALDYAAGIFGSDEQMRNELCIARSLLALNQDVFALQRLERILNMTWHSQRRKKSMIVFKLLRNYIKIFSFVDVKLTLVCRNIVG